METTTHQQFQKSISMSLKLFLLLKISQRSWAYKETWSQSQTKNTRAERLCVSQGFSRVQRNVCDLKSHDTMTMMMLRVTMMSLCVFDCCRCSELLVKVAWMIETEPYDLHSQINGSIFAHADVTNMNISSLCRSNSLFSTQLSLFWDWLVSVCCPCVSSCARSQSYAKVPEISFKKKTW